MVLFEASDRLGGQLKLASAGMTRRQIWGVADWLINEVAQFGVETHLNTYAETDDVVANAPDVVIVATGGWPDAPAIDGAALITSSWNVLSGEVRLNGDVLLFDEVGDHPALVCADVMARMGCAVQHVSPDRATAHDLGPTNSAVALRDLAKQGVSFTCFQDLIRVAQAGNRKEVTLRHVLTGETSVRSVDHVVVEHGAKPMDALYHDLQAGSRNLGQIDQAAVVAGQSPLKAVQGTGSYLQARIGDAVTGRNIHAAHYDALRICKDI